MRVAVRVVRGLEIGLAEGKADCLHGVSFLLCSHGCIFRMCGRGVALL